MGRTQRQRNGQDLPSRRLRRPRPVRARGPRGTLQSATLPIPEPSGPETPSAAEGAELVIGLVTPIGTDTQTLASNLRGQLSNYSYNGVVIRLSDHLPTSAAPQVGESEDHRVRRLIKAGDDFCAEHTFADNQTGDPAALARLAVREIRRARVQLHRRSDTTSEAKDLAAKSVPRTAFILHSLKRAAEVELLRKIYGDQFILIGSQGTIKQRRNNLLGRALGTSDPKEKERVVDELIELDAQEVDGNGQQVNETYPQADYFLRDVNPTRLVQLLFREPIAPEVGEYAMYVAHASRARSLAASRKVGAAIVVGDSVVSTGYNDVPFGQEPDVITGEDLSELMKRDNVRDTLRRLKTAGLLQEKSGPVGDELLTRALKALKGGELLSVIEYQRAVHAEARAIDDATVRGVSPVGGTLYVTTFPCHLCYKHSLSVRLASVQYIEPYPKSRASSMYPLEVDTRLIPYAGVAPLRYLQIFDQRDAFKADTSGKFADIDRQRGLPLVQISADQADIHSQERLAVNGLKKEYQ